MDESMVKTFATADFVVFVSVIMLSIGIGVFFAVRNRKSNTTANYFLGNRKLKSLPVALSFVVTFQSSILILGFPAEAYAYGMQYSLQVIGVAIAYLLASVIVVPIFHPLKVTSVYEYYKLRYNENSVRYIAVVSGMIYYIFYMGLVLYGTALALESAANFPIWSSILVFTISSVVYTSIGGIKAVIWTDVFQSLIMVVGILAVLIRSTIKTGGSARVFKLSKSRLNFFHFNPDPTIRHTFWTLIIGSIPQFFYLTISQSAIQRINSMPSITAAKRMIYLTVPFYSLTWILAMFEGFTLFAYFTNKGCDPLASGQISNMNQILPFSMMDLFHDLPGFPGLVIAALAAASLSTMSSGLSSLAAIMFEDFIKSFRPNMKESAATNLSKCVVVVFGIISAGVACVLLNVKGPLGQMMSSFMGAIDGPQTGLFLTSIMFRRARPKAMFLATLIGIVFVLWVSSGQNFFASISQTPFLPLGPTDKCMPDTGTIPTDNATFLNMLLPIAERNSTYVGFINNSTYASASTTSPDHPNTRTGLQTLYSVSYMYFNIMGAIVVIVLGVTFSLLTQPNIPEIVSDSVLFPLSKLLPSFLKRSGEGKNKKEHYLADVNKNAEMEPISIE